MSFIGDAAASAGKAAAQKGAQKAAQKGAAKAGEKAAEKGAAKLGEKGAAKLGDAAAKKAGSTATQAGTDAAKQGAAKAGDRATAKLGDAAKKSPGKEGDPLGLSDPKKALSDPKVKSEKSPDAKLDDAKRAEKDALKKKSEPEKKPEEKNLLDRAKDAKKESDERSREEETTLGGKAKSVVRDVGGGAVTGALGGAAAGAVAGGVGAAPGAAIGAAKGALGGMVKNKTTRNGLIILLLAPVFATIIAAVTIFGVMSNMMLGGVEFSTGGSDSVTLAKDSDIDEADVNAAFANSDQSDYPWTLTLAWQETLRASKDETVRAFPAAAFAEAMEELDPAGNYRQISVKVLLNEPGTPDSAGGFVIPEESKEDQAKIRDIWVKAILQAGTPAGVAEGTAEQVDADKIGDNIIVYGDAPLSTAGTSLQSSFPGIVTSSVSTQTMKDAADKVKASVAAGTSRPYIVVAAGSTRAVTTEELQAVYDAAGEESAIVFVTGYNQPTEMPAAEGETPPPVVKNDWIAASNQTIRDFVASHDRARLADWEKAITPNLGWLNKDGYTILSGEGNQLYARTIADAVVGLPTMKTAPGITQRQAETIYDKALALSLGVGVNSCGATSATPPAGDEASVEAAQLKNIITAMGVAKGMFPDDIEAAKQAALIALMTMAVEGGFKNYAHSGNPSAAGIAGTPFTTADWQKLGTVSQSLPHDAVGQDYDSIGVMQQRASGSWGNAGDSNWGSDPDGVIGRLMDPSFAIGKFIQVLTQKVPDWKTTTDRGSAAQTVQVSAFPDKYQKREAEAQALIAQHFSSAPSIPPHVGLGWNGAEPGGGSSQMGSCGGTLGEGTMGVGAMPIPEGQGSISSLYGPRDCSDGISSCFHRGLDIAGFGGTSGKTCVVDIPVYSISDGIVTQAPDPGYGANNAIAIKYSEQLEWRYLHMGTSSFKVKVGDTVKAGQQIGSMGSYGASTGCHLHIETNVNGEKTDPLPIIEQGFGVTLPR